MSRQTIKLVKKWVWLEFCGDYTEQCYIILFYLVTFEKYNLKSWRSTQKITIALKENDLKFCM